MNSKILASLLVIGIVGSVAGIAGTSAFFSDTETSTGNMFKAGTIDLAIDIEDGPWYGNEPGEEVPAFFEEGDIKPGDTGETTISLHVFGNDAWGSMKWADVVSYENGCNEPEAEVDDTCGNSETPGELGEHLKIRVWKDDGDNVFEDGEELVHDWSRLTWLENRKFNLGKLVGSETQYLGIEWKLPANVGNIVQSDSLETSIEFYAEQTRNNPLVETGEGWYNGGNFDQKWIAKGRYGDNNPSAGSYELEVGKPGDRDQGNRAWSKETPESFELEYDSSAGDATLSVNGDTVSHSVTPGTGEKLVITAKSPSGGEVDVSNIKFNGVSTSTDSVTSTDGTYEYLMITGPDFTSDFTLEGDVMFDWDGTTSDERPGFQIELVG